MLHAKEASAGEMITRSDGAASPVFSKAVAGVVHSGSRRKQSAARFAARGGRAGPPRGRTDGRTRDAGCSGERAPVGGGRVTLVQQVGSAQLGTQGARCVLTLSEPSAP